MCTFAWGKDLDVAALVLVSYPLHPPRRPERLRNEHFPTLKLPCLFVSGRRDAFATAEELERRPRGPGAGDPLSSWTAITRCAEGEAEVADIVASWLAATGPASVAIPRPATR